MDTELLVVEYCIIAFILLIVIYILYQASYIQNLTKDYILTSNGHITFNEGKMSLTIDNSHNDTLRIIDIDGLDNISQTKIYSSALRTSSGHTIKSHIIPSSVSGHSSASVKFVVDTELNHPASYDGWLTIRGPTTQHIIPINISSLHVNISS